MAHATAPYAAHDMSDGIPTNFIAVDPSLLELIHVEAAYHDDFAVVELCEQAMYGSTTERSTACDAIYARLGGR